MKNIHKYKRLMFIGLLASLSSHVMADVTVDKSNGLLTITSDIDGKIRAIIVGPDDSVVVNERFSGNSFSWAPSSGPDGAYRYDVRFTADSTNNSSSARLNLFNTSSTSNAQDGTAPVTQSDYAGGSVEVINGQIVSTKVVKR